MNSTSQKMLLPVGLCLTLACPSFTAGQLTFPERPGPGDFLVDQAQVFSPEQAEHHTAVDATSKPR